MMIAGACAGGPTVGAGDLLIVGGGLRAENTEVLGAFGVKASVPRQVDDLAEDNDEPEAAPTARVLVLPTASGVPAESGPGARGDIAPHLGANARIAVLDLRADMTESGDDPFYADAIREANALWFTGGVQSRILGVFRPQGSDSEAYRAARVVLENDGIIAGTSAGAAMMSDPMIAWGRSEEALLVGSAPGVEDRGLGLEKGMGFFPFGLVDQHFLRRGRFGRLVAALEETGRPFGFGVADNRALAVDLGAAEGTAVGDRAVCLLDTSRMEREGLSRLGLRFSLAGGGDRIDLRTGVITPASGKRAVGRRLRASFDESEGLKPFGRETLAKLVDRCAERPDVSHRAEGRYFVAVVRADEESQILARSARLDDICALNLRLDLIARPGAEEAAEALRVELEAARRRAEDEATEGDEQP